MQHGAVFRHSDLVAAKHGVNVLAQTALFSKLNQKPQRFAGDPVLRVVKINADGFLRKALAAFRIIGKKRAQMNVLDLLIVCFQRFPCSQLRQRNRLDLSGHVAPFFLSFCLLDSRAGSPNMEYLFCVLKGRSACENVKTQERREGPTAPYPRLFIANSRAASSSLFTDSFEHDSE